LLKCLRRADEFRDVRAKLLEGRNFPAAKFIPMLLVNSEQLDEKHHRVVFSQPMFIAPLGNGLGEVLVEVRLFMCSAWTLFWWQEQVGDGFNLGVKLPLPRLKPLPVEQAESRMLFRRCDCDVLRVERLNQPILQAGHGNFAPAKFVFELRTHFGRFK
jgi:hypothetical protein